MIGAVATIENIVTTAPIVFGCKKREYHFFAYKIGDMG